MNYPAIPEVIRPIAGAQFERRVPCHTTNTKEILSLLDGNQILLIIGRTPRTRIPRSAIPFPAIRILRCLRPNVGEIGVFLPQQAHRRKRLDGVRRRSCGSTNLVVQDNTQKGIVDVNLPVTHPRPSTSALTRSPSIPSRTSNVKSNCESVHNGADVSLLCE